MKRLDVDVAIIGAGTAGMTAYKAALEYTDSVVVIESGDYGTTCARVGCMPSKLLIAAANVTNTVDSAQQFGIDVAGKHIDGRQVMQRVKAERDRFVGFVVDAVNEWPEHHKLRGKAVFTDANTLQVGDHCVVKAKRIIIATGSRAHAPKAWYELGDRLLINDDVFQWQTLPKSVAVAGTGVIGMELSQALSRLGVTTHLLGRSGKFGPVSDPEISCEVESMLEDELHLHARADIKSVTRMDNGVAISLQEGSNACVLEVDYLIAATGRRPNLDGLNLQAAGVALSDKGMPSFNLNTGQIEDTAIFIAGDASDAHPLLHEAADDGKIAGKNAGRYPDVRAYPRRASIAIIFTEPQIMQVGKNFNVLSQQGCNFKIGEVNFKNQGRSRVIGHNKGLLRVYGECETGLFLVAEMIGPAAEHIAHLLAWSVQHGLTVQQMLDNPYYHPVIEEGVRTALQRLNRALKMGPEPVAGNLDCGPGA